MSNKCRSKFSLDKFFNGFERKIILSYALISFILNIIIIVSIYLAKNKKLSNIIKLTGSILITNFINIFAYTFEWVTCKEEYKDEYKGESSKTLIIIGLLFGNSESNNTCKLQSLFILFSSMSQDYLMILFFYIVNRRKVIKSMIINLLIFLCIIFPIIISFLYLKIGALGLNDDFCYLKKYQKYNSTIDLYEVYQPLNYFSIIIYSLRTISFSITIYFLINISKYIIKQKLPITYMFNKLSIFFIQLFKLFIILIYRITNLFIEANDNVRRIYNILSTVDGVLMPLAYILINRVFCSLCDRNKRRKLTLDEDSEEDFISNNTIFPRKKLDDAINSNSVSKTQFIGADLCYNSNNFDISYA